MKKVPIPEENSSYVVTGEDLIDLAHRFPRTDVTDFEGKLLPGQTRRSEQLNRKATEFAVEIVANCPKSREQAIALTNLEQALFWARSAITRNEIPEKHESSTQRVENFRNRSFKQKSEKLAD